MTEQWTIQPEESYTPEEKEFCKFLSDVCGVKILLGFGPLESWAVQKEQLIVIDKQEHARALVVATLQKNYNSALLLLSQTLSHLMAHVKVTTEEHDVTFYQTQVECLIILMNGMIKSKKAIHSTRGTGRKQKDYHKSIIFKSAKIRDTVIESLKKTVSSIRIKVIDEHRIEVTSGELEWGTYIRLLNTLNQLGEFYKMDMKIERGKCK
jgi:hypothetical protein